MADTYNRFLRLIAKGPKVRCSRSGRYFSFSETNPDGNGGRIAKVHDFLVHNEETKMSKHRQGPDWYRGYIFQFVASDNYLNDANGEPVIDSLGQKIWVA